MRRVRNWDEFSYFKGFLVGSGYFTQRHSSGCLSNKKPLNVVVLQVVSIRELQELHPTAYARFQTRTYLLRDHQESMHLPLHQTRLFIDNGF